MTFKTGEFKKQMLRSYILIYGQKPNNAQLIYFIEWGHSKNKKSANIWLNELLQSNRIAIQSEKKRLKRKSY